MPVNRVEVEKLRQKLAEAEREMMAEDGMRYRILQRLIPPEEMERYLAGLTDREEKVLFGLELPEEPKRRGRKPSGERQAKAEGNLACPYCDKTGLTQKGLSLHIARLHKGQPVRAREEGAEAEAA